VNIIINPANEDLHALCCCNKINLCGLMTLDQIEDLEINLSNCRIIGWRKYVVMKMISK